MMKTIEVKNTDARENLTTIRACLVKAVKNGDKEVCIFSTLFFVKGNLDRVKTEISSQLGSRCHVKSSRPSFFCGFMMTGLEVQFLYDDDEKELLISRILSLFSGSWPFAENKKG